MTIIANPKIEEWLQGKVGFSLSDLSVSSILDDRNITIGTVANTLTEKQKDLCWADALMIYVTSSNKGSYKIQDGSSAETLGSEYFVDRDSIQNFAYALYSKWDETPIIEPTNQINNATPRW
jgi:hypothetical protein